MITAVDFGNRQIEPQPKRPPKFTSFFPTDPIPFGTLFRYDLAAFDPDGDPLTFDLSFGRLAVAVPALRDRYPAVRRMRAR